MRNISRANASWGIQFSISITHPIFRNWFPLLWGRNLISKIMYKTTSYTTEDNKGQKVPPASPVDHTSHANAKMLVGVYFLNS